eukprot:4226438-Prymnesium_polylepis.1
MPKFAGPGVPRAALSVVGCLVPARCSEEHDPQRLAPKRFRTIPVFQDCSVFQDFVSATYAAEGNSCS